MKVVGFRAVVGYVDWFKFDYCIWKEDGDDNTKYCARIQSFD